MFFNFVTHELTFFLFYLAWGLTMVIIPPAVVLLWGVLFGIVSLVKKNDQYRKIHFPVSVLVTVTFAHPVVTKAAVKLLACRRVAGQLFLDADFNLRCDSEEYRMWAIYVAIPLLICFTFGVPLAYGAAMYRHVRRRTLMLEREVYGFLFSGFRLEVWWFELWNTLRKSLFTISSVLFAPLGVMMQTWAALVLLLVFLIVFSISQPYEQVYLNNLERSALSISVITLLCGLGLFTNEESDEDAKSETFAVFLTVAIVFLNVMFILNVIKTFSLHSQYLSFCKRFQKKQEETTLLPTVVAPRTDKHIYAMFKLRHKISATIAKRTQDQEQEDKCKTKVKLVAVEIRVEVISKVGKDVWQKMTWQQRHASMNQFLRNKEEKGEKVRRRSSKLFTKKFMDRVVHTNISNNVIEVATMSAAHHKKKVIARKEEASYRLQSRLASRRKGSRSRRLGGAQVTKTKKLGVNSETEKQKQELEEEALRIRQKYNQMKNTSSTAATTTTITQEQVERVRFVVKKVISNQSILDQFMKRMDTKKIGHLTKSAFISMIQSIIKKLGGNNLKQDLLESIWKIIKVKSKLKSSLNVEYVCLSDWLFSKHVEKLAVTSDWTEMLDQTSGHPYWCNNKTGISSWENPENVVVVKQQQKIRSSDYVALQSAVASKVANIPVDKIFHKLDRKKIGKIQYKQFQHLLKLVSDKKLPNNLMEEAWSYASNGTNEMDQNELKVWIDLCIESAEIERKKVALADLAKEFGFDEDD